MTELNAIETRTNSHYLLGNGTVCNPNKLPKGELFIDGVTPVECSTTTFHADGSKTVKTWVGTKHVVCNKCRKVDHTGRRG